MSNAKKTHKPGDGSTGPLTGAGKLRSSCNATAHGARSERHIILADESADDFEDLRSYWFFEFDPLHEGEEDMIERVAETHWRLMRCERLLNEAEAEAFAIDLKPRNWPAEERKYVELMMRYRTAADRAFRAARRDVEGLQRNRMGMIHLEEKARMAVHHRRQAGLPDRKPKDEVAASESPATNDESVGDKASDKAANAEPDSSDAPTGRDSNRTTEQFNSEPHRKDIPRELPGGRDKRTP